MRYAYSLTSVYLCIEDGAWMARSMASQLLASCLEALKSLSDSQFDKLGRILVCGVGVIGSLLTKDSSAKLAPTLVDDAAVEGEVDVVMVVEWVALNWASGVELMNRHRSDE